MNKSCPFCGKNVAIIDTLNYTGGKASKYRVQCQECKVATAWYETADEAWAAWNMRKTSWSNTLINKNVFILNNLIYIRNQLTGNCSAQKEFRGKLVRIKEDVFFAAYEECKKITAGDKGKHD